MNRFFSNRVYMIIDITFLAICMLLQALSWILHSVGMENLESPVRIISYSIFVISLVGLAFLFESEFKKGRRESEQRIKFSRIACSLAADYESVYYINTKDNSYVEYGNVNSTDDDLNIISTGEDFFADVKINSQKLIYEEDIERFQKVFNKDNLYKAFKNSEIINLDYRLLQNGAPLFYSLKVTKGTGEDSKYIIVGVKNVDARVKAEHEAKNALEEGITYGKIALALASRYEVLYYVDIETGEYAEYSSSDKYSKLEIGAKGKDFFGEAQENMKKDIYPEDYPMMAETMRKEAFINELNKQNMFSITYRLMLNDRPEYVKLRAVRPKDDDRHVIVGVTNINESVQREEEFKQKLDIAMDMANRDALTGVKNKLAYNIVEKSLNEKIESKEKLLFAIVVCDLNNLKRVNDTSGHTAGDDYIRSACRLICHTYKHSPVYRIGGDEFTVILQGEDYDNRDMLLTQLREQIDINKEEAGVIVACGMSFFKAGEDTCVENVFERADFEMYKNKKALKAI